MRTLALRIVGVVEYVPSSSLDAVLKPNVYIPYDQFPYPASTMSVVLRAKTNRLFFDQLVLIELSQVYIESYLLGDESWG